MFNQSTRRLPPGYGLGWFRNGLFWRTFFLLGFLITASMVAWVLSYRMVERGPRTEQLAGQIVSIVTITRAALTHSAPEMRRELLFDLSSNEGIRIYPLEKTDVIKQLTSSTTLPELEANVTDMLGDDTQFAASVNGVEGFWISFDIDRDAYWLMLDRGRLDRVTGLQWFGWAAVALMLSLFGAAFFSALINRPLAQLTAAARAIAKGQQPLPLPETGPTEIEEANRSFNHMVADLNRVESDRVVILAGISHDLRTPLARMLLEVEMAHLSPEARDGMHSDIAQMDAIISQFLDYAKPLDANNFGLVNLSDVIDDASISTSRQSDLRVKTQVSPGLEVMGNPTDLGRVIHNVLENARRYGKSGDSGIAEIDLVCRAEGGNAIIEISDHGSGVPEQEIEQLQRPFTRLDSARGQANGAGLGLAIVSRIILRHSGKLSLSNRSGGGLSVQIQLPLAPAGRKQAEAKRKS
ncbi:ATP-binding protein [Herbaspirillum sp. RTI4]|uniref:ATP-binding protein n=1 Tax=Herbaspirillum sp. RTI4 TaxID=3048640 RepID=UPI002AB33032|nr:ATP-binding protein [Herbaspirillum sp. RTI4]MDY7578662.1 ATP-binding protein [Herbaspirillum sp. RTI4]MEA9980640.1 ATP-binding protein [Herbaspirillum sp. RTI4]